MKNKNIERKCRDCDIVFPISLYTKENKMF